MIEQLEQLDKEVFLYLNDMHSPFWDAIMIFMSEKLVWIPFYLGLIGYIVWRYRRKSIPMLLLVIIAIGLSDFVASGIMKPYFMRLRPCHDPTLSEFINIVEGCGGRFGFISSHAANTFALAVFFNLVLSDRYLIFKSKGIDSDRWEYQLRQTIQSMGIGTVLNLTVAENRQAAKDMLAEKVKAIS